MTAVIPDMARGIRETEGPGRSLTGPKGSQVAAALPDALSVKRRRGLLPGSTQSPLRMTSAHTAAVLRQTTLAQSPAERCALSAISKALHPCPLPVET